jgi:tellurite resistance protein
MSADLLLLADLARLGLDEHSYRAVVLLPMIEVAWADRSIQAQERKHILEVATGHGLLSGRGAAAVEGWLKERPSDETLELGRSVLVRLAHKRSGIGADVPEHALDTVVELCAQVAESAGGLFGLFWRVSPHEREVIRKIGQALENHRKVEQKGWGDLVEELRTREFDLDDLKRQV